MTALAHAYALIGDLIYKNIGPLPEKERSMLEEKLRRSTGLASPATGNAVLTSTLPGGTPLKSDARASANARLDLQMGLGKPSGILRIPTAGAAAKARISGFPMADQQSSAPINASPTNRRASHLPQPRSALLPKVNRISSEQHRRSVLASQPILKNEEKVAKNLCPSSLNGSNPFLAISSDVPEEAVDALKVIQRDISHCPQELMEQAVPLVHALSLSMSKAFSDLHVDTAQSILRLCKHLMQTLSGFFDHKPLSMAVSQEGLIDLLSQLTHRLLETAASTASEAITSLSKVLNMVLIRIFHNANRSSCFG